jgi:ATP-dependent DNA helicase RecG
LTPVQLQAKLDELRSLPGETEWVEFKHNNEDPQAVGEYISALSNAAALHRQTHGYIVWGIENDTHNVLGTTFRPHKKKGKGNEDLEPWLARQLSPRIDFSIHEFSVETKRIVLFRVQAANTAPVAFSGREYIRVGSHKKPLKDYTEKERALWGIFSISGFEWGIAHSGATADDVVALLDYEAYFRLTKTRLPNTQTKLLARLAEDSLIVPQSDVFDITNLGAVLFARDLSQFGRLGRKSPAGNQVQGNGTGSDGAGVARFAGENGIRCRLRGCDLVHQLVIASERTHRRSPAARGADLPANRHPRTRREHPDPSGSNGDRHRADGRDLR